MKYKNVPDLFFKRATKYAKRVLIRHQKRASAPFEDISWKDTEQKVEEISLGLKKLGVRPGQNVGLLSATCLHWLPCDFGIMSLGAVTIPLYHNATSDSVAYIVNHAEIEIVIVRNKIQLQKLRGMWEDLPKLRYVIVMIDRGDIPTNDPKILTLEELQQIGREELKKDPDAVKNQVEKIELDETCSIIYTSGTTGTPKGVVLTHRNFLVAALSFYQYVPLEEGFKMLSFLPLAHIFERVASEIYGIDQGVIFSYCEKLEDLPRMMLESECNMIAVVPRMLEKMHDKIMLKASRQNPLAQKAFQKAVETGKEYMRKKIKRETISWELELKYSLAYNTILKKVKDKIAPHLKIFVVGGAPFAPELSYFFLALGFTVIEGYGLTETSAPITVNPPWANKPGTVGIPFRHYSVKISDEGEIVCKGDSVFKEYYKNPEATAEVKKDGWFYTGDLGAFDEEGYLKITGRKKDIIITAGGKNIAPQRVEHALLQSPYLAQIVILGDREKYLAALVVLNNEEVNNWLKSKGITPHPELVLREMPEVQDLVNLEIKKNSNHLGRFEQVKAFHILDHELTIESGELTPTLKVKRNVIREKYADIIKPLFAKTKK